jgi:hypothetical protein
MRGNGQPCAGGLGLRWRLLMMSLGAVVLASTGCDTDSPGTAGIAEFPDEPILMAGTASVTVSPEPGAFIAGDARNRRFSGEHDPLFARALFLSDGATALALVVVDNIGLVYPDIERMRRRAAELTGDPALPPERVVIGSTHTHSGPDVVGLWGEHELSSGRDEVYMDRLVEAVAAQVAAAAAVRRRVTVRVAAGDHELDWVRNVSEPGLLDRRVTVMQLLDDDGASVATLTNFACHPTVLDAVFDQVSSDYVAGFYRHMAEHLEGEHLFLQGAIGGWVQPDRPRRDVALALDYGESVARTALELLSHSRSVAPALLRFASLRFEVPLENPGFSALLEAGVLSRELRDGRLTTESAWFAVGDVEFVTHPGETSPAHAIATRELLGVEHSMVLGLTLDALGYILKPEYFAADAPFPSADYLTATSVGPEAAPRLLAAIEVLARGR